MGQILTWGRKRTFNFTYYTGENNKSWQIFIWHIGEIVIWHIGVFKLYISLYIS